jgi:hypothetical protein
VLSDSLFTNDRHGSPVELVPLFDSQFNSLLLFRPLVESCVGEAFSVQTPAEHPITVTYRSGTHPTQGWDVMHVIYSQGGRAINSFVIARDAVGTIVRRTDIILDYWEITSDADDLRGFQKCFDDRDRLMSEQCKCGHLFSNHTRDVGEAGAMKVDDALLGQKRGDIFSGNAEGESSCTECDCRQWKPAHY